MSEPNVWLSDGEPVLIIGKVVDSHWRDKGLYQVAVKTNEGTVKLWLKDAQLQEVPEA